jgi:hypothetical protein
LLSLDDGATFHAAIRFGSLVGNDDLLVLYHSASFIKQDRAANVMLFEHPTITLPLFLA